jgi:hypothetical protein
MRRSVCIPTLVTLALAGCGGPGKPNPQSAKLHEYKEIFRRDQSLGEPKTEEALESAGMTPEQAEDAWNSGGFDLPGETGLPSAAELGSEAKKEHEEAAAALGTREPPSRRKSARGA